MRAQLATKTATKAATSILRGEFTNLEDFTANLCGTGAICTVDCNMMPRNSEEKKSKNNGRMTRQQTQST